jgi:NAD(P)-dependent dehydrogenase (short-subunit alcohol dehydrogenase family)
MIGVYNALKEATAMITDTMRLGPAPFGIKVIDLKTGAVESSLYANTNMGAAPTLPQDSIYNVAKEEVEKTLTGKHVKKGMMDKDVWARQVVSALSTGSPSPRIWKGGNARTVWLSRCFFPFRFLDSNMKNLGALDIVEQKLASQQGRRQ